ncbi:MAG: efflux RND transporter periplasmic adaptor subunit [Acidobacteriota bacterium]
MKPIAKLAILALATITVACRGNDNGDRSQAGERPVESITHYTEATELFVEFPRLARGTESAFAVHLTTLVDFKPVASGTVTIVLSGGPSPEERFTAEQPSSPGIFRPVVRPLHASTRRLTVLVEAGGATDRHDLGEVTVSDSAGESAGSAEKEHVEAAAITFLKEQQWRVEFATAPAGPRRLRESVTANGVIRARPEGEAVIGAPAAGRVLRSGPAFPRIGAAVHADEVLVVMAPRVEGEADAATLDQAVARAQLEVDRWRRERERLEALYAQEAVPQRRVAEARHEEAAAEADLDAARRRLAQFHGTQRAGGDGASGRIDVSSPIAGSIEEVRVAPGAYVEAGTEMFHVVDMERLWLEVRIPELDIGRVRGASEAWFEVQGFERPFEVKPETGGRVIAFGGMVEEASRTAPLVFEIRNSDRSLRVGMFAQVHVVTGKSIDALAIPVSALQEEGGQSIAYVQAGGETFERRALRLGVREGDFVQVLDGLRPGDRVVTRGAYYVRLAASSTSLPAHGHAH